jgi:hypothetical protein
MERLPTSPIGPFVFMEHISRPVLDALLQWSNDYVLPSENTIKLQPHPEQWGRGTEEKVCNTKVYPS